MLKYKVKDSNKTVNYSPIDFEFGELQISLDSKSISGIFDRKYQIQNKELIGITTVNNSSYTDVTAYISNVSRQGYFESTKVLPIYTMCDYKLINDYDDSYQLINDDGETFTYKPNKCIKLTRRYVIAPNNKIYYEQYNSSTDINYQGYYKVETYDKNASTVISMGSDGYFELSPFGTYTGISSTDTAITISMTYYVDNGIITYDDIDYDFEENYTYTLNDGNLVKSLNIEDESGNTIVSLTGFTEYDKPRQLSKFSFERPSDIDVSYDTLASANKYYYVLYQDKKYTLKFDNGKWRIDIKDGCNTKTFYYTLDGLTYDYESIFDTQQYFPITVTDSKGNEIEYKLPILSEYRTAYNGQYLFIYTLQNYNFSNGSSIFATILTDDKKDFLIMQDLQNKYYIEYFGKRLYLADYGINSYETYKYTICEYTEGDDEGKDVKGNEFEIEITSNNIAIMIADTASTLSCIGYYTDDKGNITRWQLERQGERIRAYKMGTVITYSNGGGITKFHNGSKDYVIVKTYKLNAYRYVDIDGHSYKTNISYGVYTSDSNEEIYTIPINLTTNKIELTVEENRNNWFICKPKINIAQYVKDNEPQATDSVNLLPLVNGAYMQLVKDIINASTTNDNPKDAFKYSSSRVFFSLENATFGKEYSPAIFDAWKQNIMDEGNLKLFKRINSISIPISFASKVENNLYQEDIVENQFYEVEAEKSINKIIDMEKDIYYPVIDNGDDNFDDVYEIVFNLHFRTRDLDTWKQNNKTYLNCDNDEATNITTDNWNVLDNYHQITGDGETEDDMILKTNITKDEVFSSDLVYFLNFTEDDVFYQKSKIGNSFLRLSFYDSTDPNTQNLLHTSTIFMNENILYKKYINNIDNEIYCIYNKYKKEKPNYTYCNVNSEPITSIGTNPGIDYTKDRLDSSFSVLNRYETDTSSEGFYLYMFKEYGTKFRPSPVFMKVEFNHAGEGKTIAFTMPTIDSSGKLTCMAEDLDSIELTTQLTQDDVFKEFTKGLPLNKVLINQYIRLEVKYDEVKHRYVYFVPNGYGQNDDYWKNNKMVFNLWEIKYQDES